MSVFCKAFFDLNHVWYEWIYSKMLGQFVQTGRNLLQLYNSKFLSFFLPIRLNLRGGHQTGFGIQVQRGGGLVE